MEEGAITIGSNISSLKAQRRVGESSDALSKVFERLSSGMRINKASDDAAGLSIADTLSVQSRVFGRGVQNLNDGISALAIADSAIGDLVQLTTRIIKLANQAANGTYSNAQRRSLDTEAQSLSKEFQRIAQSTQFNGIPVFDGTLQGLRLQAGFGVNGGVASSLGGRLGTGQLGDLNGDGILAIISANYISESVSVIR